MNSDIITTHNDPITNLHSKIDNLKKQSNEYSKLDKNVMNFNGLQLKKDNKKNINEKYTDYIKHNIIKNKNIFFIILLLVILIIVNII